MTCSSGGSSYSGGGGGYESIYVTGYPIGTYDYNAFLVDGIQYDGYNPTYYGTVDYDYGAVDDGSIPVDDGGDALPPYSADNPWGLSESEWISLSTNVAAGVALGYAGGPYGMTAGALIGAILYWQGLAF